MYNFLVTYYAAVLLVAVIDCVNPNVAQIFVENLAIAKPTKNTC
jgi:hypothetical protein